MAAFDASFRRAHRETARAARRAGVESLTAAPHFRTSRRMRQQVSTSSGAAECRMMLGICVSYCSSFVRSADPADADPLQASALGCIEAANAHLSSSLFCAAYLCFVISSHAPLPMLLFFELKQTLSAIEFRAARRKYSPGSSDDSAYEQGCAGCGRSSSPCRAASFLRGGASDLLRIVSQRMLSIASRRARR